MANRKGQPKPQSVCSVFESYLIVPTVWNVILRDKLVIESDRAGPGRAKGFSSQCAGQAATENAPHPSPARRSVHMCCTTSIH